MKCSLKAANVVAFVALGDTYSLLVFVLEYLKSKAKPAVIAAGMRKRVMMCWLPGYNIFALIGELKEDTRENKDVRKQRLLFDALNYILDHAGYKAPDKLQADIKQENKISEDMTKEELIDF